MNTLARLRFSLVTRAAPFSFSLQGFFLMATGLNVFKIRELHKLMGAALDEYDRDRAIADKAKAAGKDTGVNSPGATPKPSPDLGAHDSRKRVPMSEAFPGYDRLYKR
jgi:hypothetical protein